MEASSAEQGPLLGDPKDHGCVHFLGGQSMVMECCLQWKQKIQNVQGQRNLRRWSKAFYLSQSVSHLPKGLERGPIPTFTVTELCDHKYLEILSSYFLTIGQAGFEKWWTLGCQFSSWLDFHAEVEMQCKVWETKISDPSTDATLSSVLSVPPGLAWPPTT